MAAASITSQVVGKVELPAGAGPDGTAAPKGGRYSPVVSRPFDDTAPEIKELIRTVLGLYSVVPFSPDAGHKLLSRFVTNAVWDVPNFFVRGSERIRLLSRLLGIPTWRVDATPRVVTVSMINDVLGRIDVEGVIEFYLRRFWPISMVVPEKVLIHVSWSIVARGEDDRIMSVTERLHNLPEAPYAVRALVSTAMTTAAMTLGNF